MVGLVMADVMLPLGERITVSPVLAQSRKGSKKKSTVRRPRSRRPSARRRTQRRTASLRAGQQIPPDRVLQIQRILMKRGFLKEATGVYDHATVEAMKAFQAAENIAVSGYPTAHALHRLGLSPGPTTTTSKEAGSSEADHKSENLKEGLKK
jgi:peptidoglycan hydrolase-like protein with peptidoglycan-binding domain